LSANDQNPSFRRIRRGERPIEGHAQKVMREIAEHAHTAQPNATSRKDFASRYGALARR